MGSQQGSTPTAGSSPTEDAVEADPDRADVSASNGTDTGTGAASEDSPPAQAPTEPAEASSQSEIAAAGGTIIGEARIDALADRSRVRRAPRYRRFAVLGGLLGLLIAAVATPFARYDNELAMMQGISPSSLFLVLACTLVPLGILVSCAVAMISDRAARVPESAKRKKKTEKSR